MAAVVKIAPVSLACVFILPAVCVHLANLSNLRNYLISNICNDNCMNDIQQAPQSSVIVSKPL